MGQVPRSTECISSEITNFNPHRMHSIDVGYSYHVLT